MILFDGKTCTCGILYETACPAAEFAAKELGKYFFNATQTPMRICETPDTGMHISLGNTALMHTCGLSMMSDQIKQLSNLYTAAVYPDMLRLADYDTLLALNQKRGFVTYPLSDPVMPVSSYFAFMAATEKARGEGRLVLRAFEGRACFDEGMRAEAFRFLSGV